MKNEPVVTLKSDANCAWIAVLDPASGKRGRYTVYRLYRWADKWADILGHELDLTAARKLVGKREPEKIDASQPSFDHDCDGGRPRSSWLRASPRRSRPMARSGWAAGW